jgi:hypothetical protein
MREFTTAGKTGRRMLQREGIAKIKRKTTEEVGRDSDRRS